MPQHRAAVFGAVRLWLDAKGFTAERIAALDQVLDDAGVPLDEAPAVPVGTNRPARRLFGPAAFFANLRTSGLFVAGLDQQHVDGINGIVAACVEAGWPIAFTAYALATAYHETKATMQPVREAYWLDEEWRRRNLRYFPHYGRGFVQLTWPKNYQRADDELQLGGRLVTDLDLAMDPVIAAKVMVRGMEEGWFTTRKLADTLPESRPGTFDEFKASRPIINGHDRDADIANYALRIQAALTAGEYA